MGSNIWKKHINQRLFTDVDESLFRNYSFKTLLSYIFGTWLFVILKFAFFISDLYTCIKLLAYNKWSNNVIKPYLPFRISKWLFSACILFSIVLLLWNIISGIRIYQTHNITECYVNNVSRNYISIANYSKFCIFDKISSHGTFQWFAFFVFFELKSCLGLILCDTPRQVINGLTLWSILITVHNGNGMNLNDLETFEGLINKIRAIAVTNHEEAVLLSFVLFSFILWTFFMAKLIFALICCIFVYFELIREGKHNGLRDYIYVTISKHVDDLIVKQTKKSRNGVYQNHLLTAEDSILELDILDSDSIVSKPMFKLYNDSFNSLHQLKGPRHSISPLDVIDTYDENLTDSLNEPVPLVSTIPPQGEFFKKNYIRNLNLNLNLNELNDRKLDKYGFNDTSVYFDSNNNKSNNQYFQSNDNIMESNKENEPFDLTMVTSNNNIQKISENTDYTIPITFDKMKSDFNPNSKKPVPLEIPLFVGVEQNNDTRIFTPSRAYFKDLDLENSPFKMNTGFSNIPYTGKHNY